jgi:hypothetical protein
MRPAVGIEPPPSVARADRMKRPGGLGRIRTGAKTATKDQERAYLERFRRLAEEPDLLVPRWAGPGSDPLDGLRRDLRKVSARRESGFWLKWYGRGKHLHSAYAQTLLVLRGGRIVSFAAMKFRGHDVKYILRGNGLRDKLIGLQNFDQPDVRLLAYLDLARRRRLVLVSSDDDFVAYPPGGPIPPETLQQLLLDAEVETHPHEDELRCVHAADGGMLLAYDLPELGRRVALCRACIRRLEGRFQDLVERHVLGPSGSLRVVRRARGVGRNVHPPEAAAEADRLLQAAAEDAERKAKDFEDVRDEDLLDWTEEALLARLEERTGGYVLVDRDLWLDAFAEAARRYGEDDLGQRALAQAWQLSPPRVRTADSTLNRLLEPTWAEHGPAILHALAGEALERHDVAPLAELKPADAFAALGRRLKTEERFASYPRFDELPPPLRLAHDLFKAHRTGDSAFFQRRLSDGVRDTSLKPLTLALARAFGQSAGIEWQYAPHEKDQALFWEPASRALARADPTTYVEALGRVAEAAQVAPPTPRPTTPPQPT